MDEPLSNLDAKLRVGMRASLSQLHARLGVTTVYVTHDQVEAMTLGHRVAVMRHGKILQVDAPQTLYREPRDLFVAAFIGSPAMNLVEARDRRRRRLPSASFACASRHSAGLPQERRSRARHPPRVLRGGGICADMPRPRSTCTSRCSKRWAPKATSTSPSTRRASARRASRPTTTRRSSPKAVAVQRPCRSARADPRRRDDPPRVDPSRFHFFDRETGASLMDRRSTAETSSSREPALSAE